MDGWMDGWMDGIKVHRFVFFKAELIFLSTFCELFEVCFASTLPWWRSESFNCPSKYIWVNFSRNPTKMFRPMNFDHHWGSAKLNQLETDFMKLYP